MKSVEEELIDSIRGWLKSGATIRASDPNGRVLELMPNGVWWTGISVSWEEEP